MGSFDEFVRFSAKLTDERIRSNSFVALSNFNLISVYVGPDPNELVMTFESPAPDDDTELNAVRFSVVFKEVDDLVVRGFNGIGSMRADVDPAGRYIFHLCAAESNISFRFGAVDVAGVRRFKMARAF
ncbi:hypothetical protein [Streptomyces sp. NPDC050548]|uniref:hypothetical protein n=1 Tax=Streptomyces sp. NPDC050548 TaxID=3365629 RepID=UPI0037A1407D